ncbi:MAG TPA: hypothetical protein VGL78_15810 [Solirubrobacteraceae bacterium]
MLVNASWVRQSWRIFEGGWSFSATRPRWVLRDGLVEAEEAFEVARALVNARCSADGRAALHVVGDFVLPPEEGRESREFQTLHFDFGVPLDPKVEQDVGRYTALYIPADFGRVSALTRLVPLARLLAQRAWPCESELLNRFVAYGKTHGAWNDDQGYVEGSLARVVEAAAGEPALPSVKIDAGFLCGMEFDSCDAKCRFFERHSLCVADVQIEVPLAPGELLVFDNLAFAHGRRGVRRPGELHQWVFGESLGVAQQRELRGDVLAAFGVPHPSRCLSAKAPASIP